MGKPARPGAQNVMGNHTEWAIVIYGRWPRGGSRIFNRGGGGGGSPIYKRYG